jgi:CRISPR-associated protein Csb1
MTSVNIEAWLTESGDLPAALVRREFLEPVEGRDGVFFPPTFAAAENSKDFPGGYNIDRFSETENVCLIDSVGSQANRIEPMFSEPDFSELVPQIVVEAGARRVSLLDAGHRAGDALVRCSELRESLQEAFQQLRLGNAVPLAKLAPTSLLFGVWDSRDTQAKAPRLLAATVRAFNVHKLTRSAQFNPALEYVEEGLLEETEEKEVLGARSERGFRHVPASASHGGVIARGDIRRDVTLHLGALRLLRGTTVEQTLDLRRYLLGLAVVAFTRPAVGYLRQGCNLVPVADKPATTQAVYSSGRREQLALSQDEAVAFARQAAKAFGVGASRSVKFDKEQAKKETSPGPKKGAKKKDAGAAK